MNDSTRTLRRLIWLYFWLLLFEGALRKWLVPGLSNALLIVRDPVVVTIYALALRDRIFPVSGFVLWNFVLAALCFVASFNGIGNLAVTVYGLRADFLHLPLIFLMPRVLRHEDIRRMGYALLILTVPMALLAVRQFQAGPSSSWNVGAGGEVGGQLFAAVGKVRASGTFSFATGLATYLAVCVAFLLYDLLGPRSYPRWLTFSAVPALALALIVSGSRTAVLSVAIVCILGVVVGVRRPAQIRAAFQLIMLSIGLTVGALALWTDIFHEGMEVHRQRFEGSGGVREGIVYRFAQDFVAAGQTPCPPRRRWAMGLGVGTNVGANLLQGRREFTLGEGEWQRVVLESGVVLGGCYIASCGSPCCSPWSGTALLAYRAGRILPLLLVGAGGLDLANGQFGQPTTLGFAVFVAGLALTRRAEPDEAESSTPPAPSTPQTAKNRHSRTVGLCGAFARFERKGRRAMKVLLVSNYAPDRQESMLRFAAALAEGLRAAGVEVEVARAEPFFGRLKAGATGLGKWLGYLDKFLLFPRRLCRLAATADLVHICDHSNAVYVRYIANRPHLVTCNDMLAIRSARGEFPQNPTGWTGRILQRWILAGLRRARKLTCISEATRDDVLRLTEHPREIVSVTYMGQNFPYAPVPEIADAAARRRRGEPVDEAVWRRLDCLASHAFCMLAGRSGTRTAPAWWPCTPLCWRALDGRRRGWCSSGRLWTRRMSRRGTTWITRRLRRSIAARNCFSSPPLRRASAGRSSRPRRADAGCWPPTRIR